MEPEILAWYFAKPDEKLAYGDGRKIAIGVVHEVDCTPKICSAGLHGSVNILDALNYAESTILYRVKISGEIDTSSDKICGKRREYLARYEVRDILRKFARKQALINIEKIKPYCSAENYTLIVKYLETGDEQRRAAAWSAAESAQSAAWSAAWSAAESAQSAARSAAQSAQSAAWS